MTIVIVTILFGLKHEKASKNFACLDRIFEINRGHAKVITILKISHYIKNLSYNIQKSLTFPNIYPSNC